MCAARSCPWTTASRSGCRRRDKVSRRCASLNWRPETSDEVDLRQAQVPPPLPITERQIVAVYWLTSPIVAAVKVGFWTVGRHSAGPAGSTPRRHFLGWSPVGRYRGRRADRPRARHSNLENGGTRSVAFLTQGAAAFATTPGPVLSFVDHLDIQLAHSFRLTERGEGIQQCRESAFLRLVQPTGDQNRSSGWPQLRRWPSPHP